jgi:hypothetical protein
MTEKELREHKVPFFNTQDELDAYIKSLVEREHDYGTCVYAMSCAAEATFNYVASRLGVTGFQASCANLDFIKRTRGMENGFSIINYTNLLYPQYLNNESFPSITYLESENKKMLKKEAKRLLRKNPNAHPDVIKRWKELSRKD